MPSKERVGESSELSVILEGGEVEKVRAFFRGMPEKEKRVHAPQCLKWLGVVRKNEIVETSAGKYTANVLVLPAAIAAYCTATYSELAKLPSFTLPTDGHVCAPRAC